MATSVLSNTILTPAGVAVVGARVVARLLPLPGFRTSDSSEIANQVETDTNASGLWSLTLERNADITPANTFYAVTEYVPSGTRIHRRVWNVSIPSSNILLLDAVITPSADLPFLHEAASTSVHGVADMAALLDEAAHDALDHTGLTGVGEGGGEHPNLAAHDTLGLATQSELDTHAADTTSVHGIADTSVLATATTVATAVSDHSADSTSVHGITDTSVLATATTVATAVSDHSADTTSVHGITDTAALETTTGSADKVSTHAGLADPHTGYVLESLIDAKGDLYAGSAADTVTRLAVGTNDHVLTADSAQATGLKWAAVSGGSGIPATTVDAKGDLLAATAADTVTRLAVGTNDHVLTADSAEATGLKWAAPSGGGAVDSDQNVLANRIFG